MLAKHLKEKFTQKFNHLRRHQLFATKIENLILAVLFCGLLWTLFSHFLPAKSTATLEAPSTETFTIDSYLPEGFVLFPLEFENQAALDPLIGEFAILNIYQTAGEDAGRGKLVAKNVKVMRAPQNPQALAALIPENQVSLLMTAGRGLYGVLQKKNPNLAFEKANSTPQRAFKIENFENDTPGGPK